MDFEKERKMLRKKSKVRTFGIIIAIVVLIAIGIGISIPLNFNDHSYTITVTDKERIVKGNKNDTSSKYLVFGDTEYGDSLVFENSDNLLRMKFNSSNIQGQLKEGNTYKITVVGIRIPFFSCYENIIDVEKM